MSGWAEVCEFLFSDLTANVNGMRDAIPHLYAPRDPEALHAASGERHLAVWPDPEGESVEPLTTGSHELISNFVLLYWEHAGEEDERQVVDQESEKPILDLAEAARDRLYEWSTQVIGDTWKVWYTGTRFPIRTGPTRWFAIGAEVHRAKEFS